MGETLLCCRSVVNDATLQTTELCRGCDRKTTPTSGHFVPPRGAGDHHKGGALLRLTMASLLLLWTSLLIGRSLQGSLILSPDQSQFSQGSSPNFRCIDAGFSVWRLIRGSRGRCGEDWGMLSGPWCKVQHLQLKDSGQYWCESLEGDVSEHIDITVIDRGVVLQAPVRPVTPGKSVSLICRHLTDPAHPASFYRDGRFLSKQPKGVLTLQRVAPSDEGQYTCEIKGERSVAAGLRVIPVKTTPTTTPAPPTGTTASRPGSAPSLLRLVVPVVASVAGLVLLLLLVLVVLLVRRCRRKKNKGSRGKRRRGKRPPAEATRSNSGNQRRPQKCPNCENSGAPLQLFSR